MKRYRVTIKYEELREDGSPGDVTEYVKSADQINGNVDQTYGCCLCGEAPTYCEHVVLGVAKYIVTDWNFRIHLSGHVTE